jgi:putative ABC transport system permease protein
MIGIALVMMRVRRAHAAIVAVLAALAIGAAVAAPLYVQAAEKAVTAVDIAGANAGERSILSGTTVPLRADPSDPDSERRVSDARARAFDRTASAALAVPEFDTVFSLSFDVGIGTKAADPVSTDGEQPLEFRQGYCERVVLDAGRCPAGPGEVVVGPRTAAKHSLHPGSDLYLQAMIYIPPSVNDIGHWVPVGRPAALSVVGVYRPAEPGSLFWTSSASTIPLDVREPVLADRPTTAAVDHPSERQSVLAYPRSGTFPPDSLAAVRAGVTSSLAASTAAGINPVTSIPRLLDRIDADRKQAAVTPTIAAVPLILLCCFVILLAAANTAQARRLELGMLKLRGSTAGDRLWMASAEILLPLLIGAMAGFVLGHVAVWLFTRYTLAGDAAFALHAGVAPFAVAALFATIIAGLLGLRRDLVTPAAELLRRVPSRSARWGGLLARTVAVALAIAAVVQLRGASKLEGVALLAPPMVVLAVALVVATAFDPIAAAVGTRAIRRGRTGVALALLHLGRRRSGSRVLAMLIVAVGLIGFAAIAYDTGARARHEQVATQLGADRVVNVAPVAMRTLLNAARTVDPDGAYAMAVMPMTGRPANLPVLAVDTPRLRVAYLPDGGVRDLDATRLLRPNVGQPIEVTGDSIELSASLTVADPHVLVLAAAILAPLDGTQKIAAFFPQLRTGTHTYTTPVACRNGCRLTHMQISQNSGSAVTVTFSSLRQHGPDADLAGRADLSSWVDRQGAEIEMQPTEAGLSVTMDKAGFSDALFGPPDVPEVLPAISSSQVPAFGVPTPQAGAVATNTVASVGALPRVGGGGALVDMEYLIRLNEPGLTQFGEVWLGPAAPADTVQRLRDLGLTVLSVRDFDTELAASADRPNAVGLRFFFVVGLLCLGLGAGGLAVAAGVELPARATELRSLRTQGMRRRVVGRAGRLSYLLVVITACVVGAGAAMLAWLLTGDRIPVVDVLVAGVSLPRWPSTVTVVAWAGSVAVLVAVALILAYVLSRNARAGVPRGRISPKERP